MRYVMLMAVIALTVAGCAKKPEKDLWLAAVETQKRNEVDNAIQDYLRLLEDYPKGEYAPEALYAIGTLYQNDKKDKPKAIEFYQRLVREFPSHATSPNAAFMIGFIYHNDLNKVDDARRAYESFLQAYPTSTLAESARFELETLGKTAEQVLKEQEAKSAVKSTPAKRKTAVHPGK
jgi:N-acetylmuramoyl-L-alanine amidase